MKLTAKIATGIALLGLAAPVFATAAPAATHSAMHQKREGRTETKLAKKHHHRHHRHARAHQTAARPVK